MAGRGAGEGEREEEREEEGIMEKACRDCRGIIESGKSVCKCGSNSTSKDWSGYVLIVDAEVSEIAKKLGYSREGRYALKVR